MTALAQDLQYAVRTFRKSPVFTVIAVLSLALGIGANTAVFTLLDQVLLRMLPVRNPQELVLLTGRGKHYGSNWGGNALSYPMYEDFRDHNQVFNGVFCRFSLPLSLTFDGRTERVSGELVSGTYFEVLGVGASAGRLITPQDDKTESGHPVAVLSHSFWKSRFAGDPAIVGKEILVNGRKLTILGVSAERFDGIEPGYSPKIRIPVMMAKEMIPDWNNLRERRNRWVNVFARLKPGVTHAQAQAGLQPFFKQILNMEVKGPQFRNASPYTRDQFLRMWVEVLPGSQGRAELRRRFEKPLLVLMAIVAVVLLIACANVANLLLARAAARQKEIAVRLALGAGRRRIVRQLLVESSLLAGAGALAGLLLAHWTVRTLLSMMPQEGSPLTISSAPDLRILLFNLGIGVLTALLFGLIPALQATRPSLAPVLKDQAAAVAGGGPVQLRKALVVSQVSLSLLLLIGAGLFLSSLRNLKTLQPGIRTTNLVGFNLNPALNGYDSQRSKRFYQDLTRNIESLPGVQSSSLASVRILEGNEWDSTITVEGYEAKPGEDMNPYFNSVSPRYFETMGIGLVAGRDFTSKDTNTIQHGERPDSRVPTVVVVNEKFARHYFGDRNALGRRVGYGGNPGTRTDMEIIGVIKDAKYTSLRDDVPRQVFVPYLASRFVSGMTVYVRTSLEPDRIFPSLRSEVRRLDPNLPVYGMRTIESQINQSLITERLIASLSSVFGLLATLLALIGLYGVMAYIVARRTREIGIRMALGAVKRNVIWLVMREVVILVGIGITIALPAAYGLSKLVEAQLYGVKPNDVTTAAVAALALALVACASGYLPARRATRVDPVRALRYE